MEQYSHYLMMMKLKKHHHILNSTHFQGAPVKSWEEQAFVEDSQGPLGGFIWPPRSYSCSFCKREFRSAQALGGHMNVHRRDRARLKQQSSNSSSHNEESTHVCNLDSNPNNFVASPPTSASLFSSPIIRQAQQSEFSQSIYVDSKNGACKRSTFEEDVETNLCVGLNNGHVSRTRAAGDFGGDGKKRKIDVMKLPILFKACSNDKEIDLELRLGDSPIVK